MKRKIKSLVLWLLGVVMQDRRAKVIYYHDVGIRYTKMGTPPELFWAHIATARRQGWNIVQRLKVEGVGVGGGVGGDVGVGGGVEEGGNQLLTTNNQLLLCFDDGFRGIWNERERFKLEGLKPTVFIPVSLVGTDGYLTWEEIKILQDEYGFDFQCHTWSHQTLAGLGIEKLRGREIVRNDAWFERELVESRRELEKRLGKTIDSLCFPAGKFSNDVLSRCAAAGYRYLFASYPGVVVTTNSQQPVTNSQQPATIIPRNLCQFASVSEFKSILRGAMVPFANRYRRMHFHDLDSEQSSASSRQDY